MADYYEFFAGGGMAHAGLGPGWTCTFANDISPVKASAYRDNWEAAQFHMGDVGEVSPADLPGVADLVWASTPCQDLSLAGNAIGLGKPGEPATRSGAFWPWWHLMQGVAREGRKPTVVTFENVVGALSSNNGADFEVVCRAFVEGGYRVGAFVVDARHWLPQSRPRLFIVGVDAVTVLPAAVVSLGPQAPWHTTAVQNAFDRLPNDVRDAWIWWSLPLPMARRPDLDALIEAEPTGVPWHTAAYTKRLLSMMSPANRAKLRQAQALGRRVVGTIYKRTRKNARGVKSCRTEVRFDGIAGCLRTPSGGSSRQTVVIVNGKDVRTRLLSSREAARLMGLPDSYRLPENYNEAYHICGDGVAVPVVRYIAQHLLEPLATAASGRAFRMAA